MNNIVNEVIDMQFVGVILKFIGSNTSNNKLGVSAVNL